MGHPVAETATTRQAAPQPPWERAALQSIFTEMPVTNSVSPFFRPSPGSLL
jgi:hypothetical protein